MATPSAALPSPISDGGAQTLATDLSGVPAACGPGFAPNEISGENHANLGEPDLWIYRDRTIGMLRRYYRLSIEVGRLPSLLGREFFRTRVTSYTVSTFEDAVIFVHDVERSLAKLDAFDRKLIAKIILQDYTQEETARLLNCGRRTIVRRFPEAVDKVTEKFLEGGLLARIPETSSYAGKSCQEAETGQSEVSCCEDNE